MSIFLLISLALAQTPEGNECDTDALSKVITSSTGDAAAKAFTKLAECDEKKANHYAKTTISTFLVNDVGLNAAVAGMKIGAEKYVLEWMNDPDLLPDEKAQILSRLGSECHSEPIIQQFFVKTAEDDPERFWGKRYYRYLKKCKSPEITEIYTKKLDEGIAQGRSQFFAVVSAYARNGEEDSFDKLAELLTATEDGEVQVTLITAMYEAILEMDKNNTEDPNASNELRNKTVEKIVEVADGLQPNALNQARTTLDALGAEGEADSMSGFYFKRKKQEDESYIWGMVATETATCKNGKIKQNIHTAPIIDSDGKIWPDEIEELIVGDGFSDWDFILAKDCKGSSEDIFFFSTEPFANMDEYKVWSDKKTKENSSKEAKKVVIFEQDPLRP
jgi:hypothetical protein